MFLLTFYKKNVMIYNMKMRKRIGIKPKTTVFQEGISLFENNQNGQGSENGYMPQDSAPQQGFNDGYIPQGDSDFYGDSGVENVTKKSKGKKAAIIGGISAAVIVGGSATAYACSDLVKNQVKLNTMKPENYYAWVCEENSEEIAKSVSESYKKALENYKKGQSGSVYFTYEASDDAKDALLKEMIGEEYKSDSSEEAQSVIDAVNNIDTLKIGANFESKKALASYEAYAQLNGDNVVSGEAVIDADNMDFFFRSADLTEKWLGFSISEDDVEDELGYYSSDDVDYLEIFRDVMDDPEKYLSPEDIEEEVSRYIGVWNETINDVDLEKKEDVDICDISVNYTVVEVEIDEKLSDKLAMNMLKELKKDKVAKKLVTDKLGIISEEEYEESIQEEIDWYKEFVNDKDYYDDDDDSVIFKTYIDAEGKVRGFSFDENYKELPSWYDGEDIKASEYGSHIFAVVGKDGDDVRGEFTVTENGEKDFSLELYAEEEGKDTYSGNIDMTVSDYEYDYDTWESTTVYNTYTVKFDDFEIVDEEKGYFNADVSIEIPDLDPIDLKFRSSGKEQEISYNISFDSKDYGTITLGFSHSDSASVDVPDKSSAYMIDVENADSFDLKEYVSDSEVESWLNGIFTKIGLKSDVADEASKLLTEEIYDELDGQSDYDDWDDYDWDYDDDDYDWDYDDDDDYDWDYDDDDDYDWNSYATGVEAEDDEAYLYVYDKDFNAYYFGYAGAPLAENAKVAKITGDGTYTVSVTADSDYYREYTDNKAPNGLDCLWIVIDDLEAAKDAQFEIKSIKIDGKEQAVTAQPEIDYYSGEVDVILYYSYYDEYNIFDASNISEWTDIEVTFEVKGMK